MVTEQSTLVTRVIRLWGMRRESAKTQGSGPGVSLTARRKVIDVMSGGGPSHANTVTYNGDDIS